MTIRALGRSPGMETKAARPVHPAVGGIAGAALAQAWSAAPAAWAARTRRRLRARALLLLRRALEYARDHRWANNAIRTRCDDGRDVHVVRSAPRRQRRPRRRARRPHHRCARPERDRDERAGGGHRRARHREALGHHALPDPGQALRAYDVAGDEAVLLDELELEGGSNTQLLIAGDTALVTWRLRRRARHPDAYVAEVDVTDPGAMSVLRSLEIDGAR